MEQHQNFQRIEPEDDMCVHDAVFWRGEHCAIGSSVTMGGVVDANK